MADQQQLERLRADVSAWNTWRKQQPEDTIDLSGANLSSADLSGADLSGANLIGANLSSADLTDTNLSSATLISADLSGTDLSGAYLRGATLISANLRGAYLNKADLNKADLSSAYLIGTYLIGAYLNKANLIGVDLSKANLLNADLSIADLNSANLRNADFSSANLIGANLIGADLIDADLIDADLISANLSNTNLRGADLSSADLSNANLSNARMAWTTLGELDLSSVKGLDTVQHDGPSNLSINTIYKSEGNIPEVFVRGTGAPDSFIEYMHALARKPIQYYTCFISYSSKDQDFAERLYNDLQGNGVRCWYARKDLKPGDFYRDRIDESISVSDKVLLILSEHSVKSAWVEDEVERAWKREEQPAEPGEPVVLFPIRLDDTVMHTERKWAATLRYLRHIGDFTGWKDHDAYQTHFQQLLHDLKQERPKTKP